MAGIKEAAHTEYDPDAMVPLLTLTSCPVPNRPEDAPMLWGKMKIKVSSNSLAYRIYKQKEVTETFSCSYELNPNFRGELESAGLKFSGISEDGGARMVELSDHHFFLGTGFVPQFVSEDGKPHPLIVAFLKALKELA